MMGARYLLPLHLSLGDVGNAESWLSANERRRKLDDQRDIMQENAAA
jgi:hypothetical protein